MQHLLRNQPAEHQARNDPADLRDKIRVPFEVDGDAGQREQESEVEHRVKGQRSSLPHARLGQLGFRILQPAGKLVWVYCKGAAVYDDSGSAIRVLGVNIDVTARKRAEEENRRLLVAVQEERDRLSALLNSINDEIWFADAEKKLTLVNRAVAREFGATVGEGLKVEDIAANFEVYRPDGTPRPADEAPPLRALRGEVVTNQEEMVRMPATGELRHRQVSGAPVRSANGAIIGSVCVVRDITERKRAEAALRESEDRFRALLAASSDVVYRMSPDWSEMRQLKGRDFIPDTETPSRT